MSHELTIEPLGRTIEVEDDQTILDACLRAGIWLPHACCHGLCATCKVQVTDGEVEHGDASPFALMDFERDEGKTLACCATMQSDVTIEADIDEEPDAENIPIRDFTGTVTRIETLTPTIRGIWFRLDQPIHFQAGQYVNLNIPLPGGEGPASRPFSIASSPGNGREIELNIRIVPGGAGTAYLHQQVQIGDTMTLTGPYGRFFVRKSVVKPMVFMAGGSGLSSPRSMILDLLEEGCGLPITLVYGQRNRAELYYHEEFLALAERYPNFTYVPAISQPDDTPFKGETGFVHEVAERLFNGRFDGMNAYLCGPPLMIDACINTLMQGRLFEADIFTEIFLSAADSQKVRSPLFRKI